VAALTVKPPTRDAARVALRFLNAGGRQNRELAALFMEASGIGGERRQLTPNQVRELAREVRDQGDARRGAEVFRRAELGCIACHSIDGQGGHVGPDLSALGTAQPIDFIIGAILEPQKEVKEGYNSISVTTRDGQEYQGYPILETAEQLVLRDPLLNTEVRLRREAIRERKQNGSLMPEGLTDGLTHAELRDLIRFLAELGQPQ